MSQDALVWRPPAFDGVAGVATRDITPPLAIRARNWGAAESDTAAGVHRPLTITALAVAAHGGSLCYLVSADLGWWRNSADEAMVRGHVLAELGCAEPELLLHLVHTHSGPTLSTSQADLPGGELVGPYLRMLASEVVSACRQAAIQAAPATVMFAAGSCSVAVQRDLTLNGREVVAFDPAGFADDAVLVGRFTDGRGRTIATMVNYACHPTTLGWCPPLLSPDWIGAAREVMATATGAPCLLLQGASGELSPREQYGDAELTDRVGRAIGHAAMSIVEAMPSGALRLAELVESGATLGMWRPEPMSPPGAVWARRIEVELAARPAMSAARLRARFPKLPAAAADERLRRAQELRAGYVDEKAGVARHPVWVWRLGDAAIVAHPGEAYSWLQTELRRRHPRLAVFVLNCTNGPGFVYLPPEGVYQRDVYQVWQTEVLAGSLEHLVAKVDQLLAET